MGRKEAERPNDLSQLPAVLICPTQISLKPSMEDLLHSNPDSSGISFRFPQVTLESCRTQDFTMPRQTKTKQTDWEVHRGEIEHLYLTERKSVEQVVEVMGLTHGFYKTFVLPYLR